MALTYNRTYLAMASRPILGTSRNTCVSLSLRVPGLRFSRCSSSPGLCSVRSFTCAGEIKFLPILDYLPKFIGANSQTWRIGSADWFLAFAGPCHALAGYGILHPMLSTPNDLADVARVVQYHADRSSRGGRRDRADHVEAPVAHRHNRTSRSLQPGSIFGRLAELKS